MPRLVLQGVVVSNKAAKTVIVKVERDVMHPVYRKYAKGHKNRQVIMRTALSMSVILFKLSSRAQFQKQKLGLLKHVAK